MTGPQHFRWAMTNFDWTAERVERLKTLWAEGYSGAEIAIELGCRSRSAVIGKVHRLKLPKRGDESKRVESRRANRSRKSPFNRPTAAQRYGQGQTAHIAPPAAKRAAPLPMPRPEAPTASAVKFEALEPHHCRWVYGEGANRMFCGCPVTPSTSWCEGHRARVFQPTEAQLIRRRHIPERQKTYEEIEKELA